MRSTQAEDEAAKMAVGALYHLSANSDFSLRRKLVQNESIFSVLADEVCIYILYIYILVPHMKIIKYK